MGTEIPVTTTPCSGCNEDMNILQPYLLVMVKAQREVLLSNEIPSADPANEPPSVDFSLGTKSGRGVILKFHDFDCAAKWVKAREGKKAKIEYHAEDEIYVPEDNPDDKEIARRKAEQEKADEAAAVERDRAEKALAAGGH